MSTVAQSYVLTGRTTFFFPFPVRFATHITLQIEGGTTVNPADYSVTGASPSATGVTVTYPSAPADGQLLTISRIVPAKRLVTFTSDAEITAANLNAEFDNFYQILRDEGII